MSVERLPNRSIAVIFNPTMAPIPRTNWLPAIALFLLAVITYLTSMTNGFIWDDPQYVVDNPTLKSVDGLWRIWTDTSATPQYYPMVHTTFWIEAQLWGTGRAAGFHVDNILLHALAGVLLWRVLISLDIPAAFFAAAIFAVHPVMVESVAWVTERKNVLSIVFYLLAFLAYQQSGQIKPPVAQDVHPGLFRNRWYLLSLLLFLFALLSKTVTCSLPAAILLIIWWKRGGISWKDIKPLLPMLILGLALSSLTSHLEYTQVGARGPDFAWSPMDRCLIAGHAICFYALKIIWPHPLMFMYPRWDLHADRSMQLIYPAIVLLMVMSLWFGRKKIGSGPLVAVLFFIGTLVPALGFVNVYPMRYSFVADHFQYLASIGIIVLIAVILQRISKFTAVIVLPLAWITWHQQYLYKDAKTLWQNTIAQNPTCWMAHVNLAGVFRSEKNFDAAMAESQLALKNAPNEADTHYDYGIELRKQSKMDAAIRQFRLAIQCDRQCGPAYSDLSRTLWDSSDNPQDQAEALSDAKQALDIQPNLADPHYVLARVAELRGDLSTAIEQYGKALAIEDDDFHSHFNLGVCLLQTGDASHAAGEFQQVLKHDDKNASAWTELGKACLNLGKFKEAGRYFQRALSINPNLTEARAGLNKARKQ